MAKAIVLVRVSTDNQDYDAQINDLTTYANSLGYTKLHQIKTKESGFKDYDSKDGWKQLTDFIGENPEYRTIFVSEISRISRRQYILSRIKEYLVKNKIQLYIKDKGYKLLNNDFTLNTDTDILFTLYAYFAESEMKQKLDRFKREKALLFSQGLSITGNPLFGYRKEFDTNIKKNRLVVNEEQAIQINRIFNLYLNENINTKQLTIECIKLGFDKYTHSQRNIKKLLKEKAYLGGIKQSNNKRINPEYLESENNPKYIKSTSKILYSKIIDEDLFNRVQDKLTSKTAPKTNTHTTLLSRLITCPCCNHKLVANYRIRKDGYIAYSYYCTYRKAVNKCDFSSQISMQILDSTIWSYIYYNVSNEEINKAYSRSNEDLRGLKCEIENLEKAKEKKQKELNIEKDILRLNLHIENIDKQELEQEYRDKTAKINGEINLIKSEITQKKLGIELINNRLKNKTKNYTAKIKSNIDFIEKNKALLKDNINYFINNIDILYNCSKYTIINIQSEYKESKVLINKRDNHRIQLYRISNNVKFINNKFNFKNETYTIEEIISLKPVKNMADYVKIGFPINIHVRQMDYKKLKVY